MKSRFLFLPAEYYPPRRLFFSMELAFPRGELPPGTIASRRGPGRADLRKSDPRLLHPSLTSVIVVFVLPSIFALVCRAAQCVIWALFTTRFLRIMLLHTFTCINLLI